MEERAEQGKEGALPSKEEQTLDVTYRNFLHIISSYDTEFPDKAQQALIPGDFIYEFRDAPPESFEKQVAYITKMLEELSRIQREKSYPYTYTQKQTLNLLSNVLAALINYAAVNRDAFMASPLRHKTVTYLASVATIDAKARAALSANTLKQAFRPKKKDEDIY